MVAIDLLIYIRISSSIYINLHSGRLLQKYKSNFYIYNKRLEDD